MDTVQKTAFETAIGIESRCLSYYRAIALKVDDIKIRQLFDLLAKDESVHLAAFCNLYQGSEEDLVNIIGKNVFSDRYYFSIVNMMEGNSTEINALRIALREEQAGIDCYSVLVDHIREPRVREVFVRIRNEANKHCDMLSEEYLRIMKITDTHEKDQVVEN